MTTAPPCDTGSSSRTISSSCTGGCPPMDGADVVTAAVRPDARRPGRRRRSRTGPGPRRRTACPVLGGIAGQVDQRRHDQHLGARVGSVRVSSHSPNGSPTRTVGGPSSEPASPDRADRVVGSRAMRGPQRRQQAAQPAGEIGDGRLRDLQRGRPGRSGVGDGQLHPTLTARDQPGRRDEVVGGQPDTAHRPGHHRQRRAGRRRRCRPATGPARRAGRRRSRPRSRRPAGTGRGW